MNVQKFAERPQTVREMAALGYEELKRKLWEGELTREVIGLAADGAQAYLSALAAGDVATPELAALRCGRFCDGCASATITETDALIDDGHVFKIWCGRPLTEDLKAERPTCGCLVALKVNGRVYPGPKVWVASAACPQRNW